MKRLEIGDDIYIRNIKSGKIYKVKYNVMSAGILRNLRHVFRLVYPYPCIKELAI